MTITKIDVNQVKQLETNYPVLRRSKFSNSLILFTSKTTGIVLEVGEVARDLTKKNAYSTGLVSEDCESHWEKVDAAIHITG